VAATDVADVADVADVSDMAGGGLRQENARKGQAPN